MNAKFDAPNTIKLTGLLESVKPIFNDLGRLINDSKKLQSKYAHQLNYLNLQFKMEQNNKKDKLVTEHDLERRVTHICDVFNRLREITTEISNNDEASQLYLEAGVLDKLQEISQRLSKLLS